MSSLLLRNGMCLHLSPPRVEQADMRITGGLIAEVGQQLAAKPGDTVEDLHGAYVFPGLVCAHTHLYSSLARGMPGPSAEPSDFPSMLESVWWKLDRSLDEETTYLSALTGALEAVRCGVTTIVDHHSSPHSIRGSLKCIRNGLHETGMRGVLCY